MSVEDTYRRTMRAESVQDEEEGCGCSVCACKSNPYTLSNSEINEIHDKVVEIAERKRLDAEQTEDAFVVALIDANVPQDEAEEICELFVRTEGEVFAESDDDEDFEDPDMPDEEEYEDEDEDDDDIIEV